jgi:hypothetical protein
MYRHRTYNFSPKNPVNSNNYDLMCLAAALCIKKKIDPRWLFIIYYIYKIGSAHVHTTFVELHLATYIRAVTRLQYRGEGSRVPDWGAQSPGGKTPEEKYASNGFILDHFPWFWEMNT